MKFPPDKIALPYKVQDIRRRIEAKKKRLDAARPLPPYILDRLRDDFAIEWTFNSNGIEGNTLTLAETKMVLEDGITVGGKTLREHFEAINHNKAINFLEDLSKEATKMRVIDVLSIHRLVLANIMDDFAGRFRPGMVRIMGANFTPPNARKVPDLIDELLSFINTNPNNYSPLILATLFHHRFVWIHPFNDGNGRSVRLAFNLLLMRAGYPPAVILNTDRKKYLNALNRANRGDYSNLLLLIFQAVERSLNIYLNSIGGDYEDYESISAIAEDPTIPYGQEYISLLARNGRIDAYKEGRAWLTTKSAVKSYISKKQK